MRGKHWLVVVGILALSACSASWWREANCPGHSSCDDPDGPLPDTPGLCGSTTCTSPQVCDRENNTCVECVTHDDCKNSGLCLLEAKTCAAPNEVMYVSDTASPNMECTRELPCQNVVDALYYQPLPKFKYIKVKGVIVDDQEIIITGHPVSIYGDQNARLQRSSGSDKTVIHVRGQGAAVALYDLGITGQRGMGMSDTAIRLERMGGNPSLSLVRITVFNNEGRGVSADGGMLTVSESTFQNNAGGGISISGSGRLVLGRSTISLNMGGGLSISGVDFDVTNNFITDNGKSDSVFGGVRIDNSGATATRRFEFNTISMNQAVAGTAPGVVCTAAAIGLQLNNNIVYQNGGGSQVVEGATNCTWNYSDIGPMGVTLGTGNLSLNPLFVNPGGGNYHLQLGSPVEDEAGPTTVDVDFDGDRRPPGGMPDMGADEIR